MKGIRWNGFSLVEMVIYVGLLVLILVSLLTGVRLMLRSYRDGGNRVLLANAGALVIERMEREIRAASSINAGGSTFASTTGALSLTQTSGSVSTTTTFTLSGGMLYLKQNSGTPTPLLPPSVGVSNFTLYQITTTNSKAVRILLGLQTATSSASSTLSATFYDTAVLRGSY